MGLRIASSTGVLSALRNFRTARAGEDRASERLASGLRVNRASDDPSALVLSEQLRSQLSALSQALENNQNARGMVDTADAALGTVSDLLSRAHSLAVAAGNTGALDPSQQRAVQASLDQTLAAIDRIGATARYGGRGLLNGGLEIVTGNVDPALSNLRLYGADLTNGFSRTVSINVVAGAARGQASGTLAPVQSGRSTVRIGGLLGSRVFTFAAGQTEGEIANAINEASSDTGVEVSGPPGARVIRSVDFGSAAFVNIEETNGDLEGITPGYATGADVNAVVDGQAASGRGNTLNVADGITGEITFVPGTGVGTHTFDILGGGATFQIGSSPVPVDRVTIGVPAVSSARLGVSSGAGNLQSLATGGANNLLANSANARRILSAAVDEVTSLRGALGSVSSRIFDANQSALSVEVENLTGAESVLRDADFAEELAASERFALLRQMGIHALRSTRLTSGAVLRLLG